MIFRITSRKFCSEQINFLVSSSKCFPGQLEMSLRIRTFDRNSIQYAKSWTPHTQGWLKVYLKGSASFGAITLLQSTENNAKGSNDAIQMRATRLMYELSLSMFVAPIFQLQTKWCTFSPNLL